MQTNQEPTQQITLTEYLQKAKALIEAGWTKGVYARDDNQDETNPEESDACAFCTLGALHRVSHSTMTKGNSVWYDAANVIKKCLPAEYDGHIPSFNDDPNVSKDDVLALFDRAIIKSKR